MTRPWRDTFHIIKQDIGTGLTDVEIGKFKIYLIGVLHSIQVYVSDISATASLVVNKNESAITPSITPIAGSVVVVTPDPKTVREGDEICVHVTTNATGTMTDLNVAIIYKSQEEIPV